MYDFYFGDPEAINKDPWNWLLTIKRMLPRWLNGIPDSEYRALYDLLMGLEKDGLPGKDGVLMETGSGASTIMLLYFALRWDTELYTWDISSNKLSYLRGVVGDTLYRHFDASNMTAQWKYIAYASTNPYVGIPLIGEKERKVTACFLDSDHTWNTLGEEISLLAPLVENGGLVAIDDGNYRYLQYNTAYINMLRTKQGLPAAEISNNEGPAFWEQARDLLGERFPKVVDQHGGTYRETYAEDIFFSYYLERRATESLGMEKSDELDHRFDAWRVYYE